MNELPIPLRTQSRTQEVSALSANKVLRNTYLLLGATLGFSALVAGLAMMLEMRPMNPFLMLGGYFALFIGTMKTRNSAWGLLFVFLLTGFLGLTLGPIVNLYIKALPNGGEVVMMALGTTAATFVALSAYAVTSKRDFSFMRGFLIVGMIAAVVLGLVATFSQMPAMSLAVSGFVVLLMSGVILYQTSAIIHGGETNYISATVTLYLSIYNMFLSLLQLMGGTSDE